jgi:glutamine amidotransferase
MCRLVAYLGHDVLLEDVLVKPVNSIVMQSLHARESTIPTNGDGFGLGWYAPEISEVPALFKSISPAWNDNNLLNLTAKIKSPCFFAHVRAASAGGVTHYNCHPFVHDKWMLMHNGELYNFISIKRHLRHLLDDDIYNWIQGETDSEHLFALFLQLSRGKDLTRLSVVADILEETFAQVIDLIKVFSKAGPSYFNVCLTDGKRMIATRYCTAKRIPPESMHYSLGSRFVAKKGRFHMLQEDGEKATLLISSEKLTDFEAEWHDVPPNHLIMVEEDLTIQLRSL